MKMFGFKIIGVVLVLALWPAAARAQLTAPREGAQIQFGPVGLYPTLQIVDAGRDSNVFDDGANPKEDYTFTVQSRALVVTRLGLNELMFSTGSDYVWFRRYKGERSSNGTYALRFNLSASRFKPFIGALRNRTRSRPNPEIDARVLRLEREALVGSNFELTERTAITATATVNDSSYEKGETFQGANLSALSRTGRAYSAGVRYAVTPLTTLVLAGNYAEDRFPKSHVRDSKTYSFVPVVEFAPEAAIRGSLAAGAEVFKPGDRRFAQYKGATFTSLLSWAIFSNMTSFDLRANRNVGYSYREDEPYYLITRARLNLTQKFVGPFELVGGAEREQLSYKWRLGMTALANPHTDITNIVNGGISITMQRGFKVLLSVEKTRRHSATDATLNFQRTRFLSTVTIGS
jgi:Putative beta-barrel porin 2